MSLQFVGAFMETLKKAYRIDILRIKVEEFTTSILTSDELQHIILKRGIEQLENSFGKIKVEIQVQYIELQKRVYENFDKLFDWGQIMNYLIAHGKMLRTYESLPKKMKSVKVKTAHQDIYFGTLPAFLQVSTRYIDYEHLEKMRNRTKERCFLNVASNTLNSNEYFHNDQILYVECSPNEISTQRNILSFLREEKFDILEVNLIPKFNVFSLGLLIEDGKDGMMYIFKSFAVDPVIHVNHQRLLSDPHILEYMISPVIPQIEERGVYTFALSTNCCGTESNVKDNIFRFFPNRTDFPEGQYIFLPSKEKFHKIMTKKEISFEIKQLSSINSFAFKSSDRQDLTGYYQIYPKEKPNENKLQKTSLYVKKNYTDEYILSRFGPKRSLEIKRAINKLNQVTEDYELGKSKEFEEEELEELKNEYWNNIYNGLDYLLKFTANKMYSPITNIYLQEDLEKMTTDAVARMLIYMNELEQLDKYVKKSQKIKSKLNKLIEFHKKIHKIYNNSEIYKDNPKN